MRNMKKRMKGIIAVSLTWILILTMIPLFSLNAKAEEGEEPTVVEDTTSVLFDAVEKYVSENSTEPKEIEVLDLEDSVFFKGSFTGSDGEITLAEDKVARVNEELDKAIDGLDFCVDVSEYGMKREEADDITADFLNMNPQYFFVENVCITYDEATDEVDEFYFEYDAMSQQQREQLNVVAAAIIDGINPSWSDVEKLFYLHDYVVLHCQYDLTYSKYDSYNCLVEGSAVCQGYAEAFEMLGNLAGIETQTVTSSQVNHAWNVVTLNGKHYFIDTTWDDPIAGYTDPNTGKTVSCHQYEQYCRHVYFLKSQDYFDEPQAGSSKNHNATDMKSGYVNIRNKYNDHEFDDADWNDTKSAVACLDDGFIYLKTDGGIYRCTNNDLAGTKVQSVSPRWTYFDMPGYFFTESFGNVVGIGDSVFVNSYDTVYKMSLSDYSLTAVYSLTDTQKQYENIYGMYASGTSIICNLAPSYQDIARTDVVTVDVSAYVTIPVAVTGVTLSQTTMAMEIGEEKQLTASVLPENASNKNVTWSSSNPSVATVSAGKVKAVSEGTATITATTESGGKKASCVVTVSKKEVGPVELTLSDTTSGISLTWVAEEEASKYRVFRKEAGGKFAAIAKVTTTSYVDTSVEKGKTYSYYVRCMDTSGKYIGAYDSAGQSIKASNLVIANIVSASAANGKVVLTWTGDANAVKYRVMRQAEGETKFTALAKVSGTTYTDKNVEGGKTYKYTIRCMDGSNAYIGVYDKTGTSVTVENIISTTITNISCSDQGVVIKWNAADGVAKYRVMRKAEGESSYTALAKVTGTTYTDTNVENGKTYTYTIRCMDATGAYVGTYDAAGKTIAASGVIYAPVFSVENADKGIVISWNAVDGAAKYRVMRKAEGETKFTALAKITGTTYTDKTAEAGKTYTYTVRCMDSSNAYVGSYDKVGKSITR